MRRDKVKRVRAKYTKWYTMLNYLNKLEKMIIEGIKILKITY